MRIVALCEFDAADVLAGHRRALRALGHDYSLIVRDAYTVRAAASFDVLADDAAHADFIDHAVDLIRRADVIQVHPAIGQTWSINRREPFFNEMPVPIGECKHSRTLAAAVAASRARQVALFHGSWNAQANAEVYAEHWRSLGYTLAATTLDYVARMGALYMPPALYPPDGGWPVAALRTEDDPLVIAHAPTDRKNCQTEEFLAAARAVGAVVDVIERRPWPEVIARKARCNAGFDHLRGSFSVNTLENCAVGIVPVFRMTEAGRRMLDMHWIDGSGEAFFLRLIENHDELVPNLRILAGNPGGTAGTQLRARNWFDTFWSPIVVGRRLEATYKEMLG